MTFKEAEAHMAMLMKLEIDYYKKHIEPITKNRGPSDKVPQEIEYEHRRLRVEVKRFGEMLATNPTFSDILVPWVVDVKGRSDSGEAAIKEVLENLDFKDFMKKHGSLPDEIRKFINESGFRLEGCGGSTRSWHIGVICNEPDSRRFCAMVQQRYRKAIDSKAIWLEKKFWGWRLPTLFNENDIIAYYRKNTT